MKVETSELQKLFEVMEEKKFSITDVIAIVQGKNEDTEMQLSSKGLPFTVDYSLTVEKMMEKTGLVNSNVTSANFPIPKELVGKKVDKVADLLHFNRFISSDDAVTETSEKNCDSATIFEQLAFAATYSDLQKQFPIVALGSVWRDAGDGRYVSVLDFVGRRRELALRWFDVDWSDYDRFLGVRK
jgi:hypothetical protein